jgi:glutamate--cysteine ligase
MSNPGEVDATPITSRAQLVAWFEAGCRPAAQFRIGTEHEKFGFRHDDLRPPPYQPDGIGEILRRMAGPGWEPILDQGNVIGLKGAGENRGASISLEPGGQFELSGAPLESLHETEAELNRHFAELRQVADPLGIGFAPLGFHPLATRAEMPWMPKSRYAIMRRYMPGKGTLGLDMMLRTCTVQVNLDFASEADMVRKLRTSIALQPVATALFANSPFTEGRPNGFLSMRAHVWTDTDPDRSGIPAVVFEPGFGFERYVDWLLDVPMYFLQRDGGLIDVAGASFRDFMAGRLPFRPGELPTIGDFADHTTTVFTDVRLKRFLEMRGADAGRPSMMLAQSALWVGLLYDEAALEAASALLRGHGWADFVALRAEVPRRALDARLDASWGDHGTVRDLARQMVEIARDGLKARARRDALGRDETRFLDPLDEMLAGEGTQAEYWLKRFDGAWAGDARNIMAEAAI